MTTGKSAVVLQPVALEHILVIVWHYGKWGKIHFLMEKDRCFPRWILSLMCFWDTKRKMDYFALLLIHYPNYANSLSVWNVFKKTAQPLRWIKMHQDSCMLYCGCQYNLIIKLVSLQCCMWLALCHNEAYSNSHFQHVWVSTRSKILLSSSTCLQPLAQRADNCDSDGATFIWEEYFHMALFTCVS